VKKVKNSLSTLGGSLINRGILTSLLSFTNLFLHSIKGFLDLKNNKFIIFVQEIQNFLVFFSP